MARQTDKVKSWPAADQILIDIPSFGICPRLTISECFPVPCAFVLLRMCISLKVERLIEGRNEGKEHLLVGNSPTPSVTIMTVATVMIISPITVKTKSFSWELGWYCARTRQVLYKQN